MSSISRATWRNRRLHIAILLCNEYTGTIFICLCGPRINANRFTIVGDGPIITILRQKGERLVIGLERIRVEPKCLVKIGDGPINFPHSQTGFASSNMSLNIRHSSPISTEFSCDLS